MIDIDKKKIKTATYDDGIMTINFSDRPSKKFRGRSTVWYELPLFERCASSNERKLLEIYEYIKYYGNPYPKSHLK